MLLQVAEHRDWLIHPVQIGIKGKLLERCDFALLLLIQFLLVLLCLQSIIGIKEILEILPADPGKAIL